MCVFVILHIGKRKIMILNWLSIIISVDLLYLLNVIVQTNNLKVNCIWKNFARFNFAAVKFFSYHAGDFSQK